MSILPVILCADHLEAEAFIVYRLQKLTPDNVVLGKDFEDDKLDPQKLIEEAKEKNPNVKLLVIWNLNADISSILKAYDLNSKFEGVTLFSIPIVIFPMDELFLQTYSGMENFFRPVIERIKEKI